MPHTKGPWRIGKMKWVVVADHPTSDTPDSGHDAVEYYGGHCVCESIGTEANAKLIAAAPELLEALSMCHNLFEAEYEDLSDQGKRARESAIAAIKKATE